MKFTNIEELMSKIGLKGYVVKSGEFKDIGSPLREMTKKERKLLQDVIDDLHQQFIDAVAEGRGVDRSKIEQIADGSFFSGARALELGLIDEIGNFNDAVDIAASLSGIKGKPVVIYPVKRGIDFWDIIIEAPLKRALNKLMYVFGVMDISPWKLQLPFYL
jgi:protease-4